MRHSGHSPHLHLAVRVVIPGFDTDFQCLLMVCDAGTRWAYHNAAYTLLDKVLENATGSTFNQYYQNKLRDRIGMNGFWIKSVNSNNVLYSNARSMARFGLLLLNKGKWSTTAILGDENYFNSMVSTSQNLNLSLIKIDS